MRIPGPPAIAVDMAGAGPLLLFLHGIGGNRSNWSDQVAHFGTCFTAVAWDARGYGDSDDVAALAFTDFADDLARLIGHFGGPAHLVGLSMGGRIALDCWRRYPALVASLTLADTSAGSKETQRSPARIEAFLARAPPAAARRSSTPADTRARCMVETLIAAWPNITPTMPVLRLIDSLARPATPRPI